MMLAALGLTAAWTASEPGDLRWRPKAGDRATYEYSMTAPGGGYELTAYRDIQVTQSDEVGFTVRTMNRGALARIQGTEIRDTRSSPVVARHGIRGELLEILEGPKDQGAFDLGRTTRFVAPPQPVDAGDTWTYEYPAEESVKGLRITYKVEGLVQSARRITFVSSQPGGSFSAKGEWLIAADGSVDRLTTDLKKVGGIAEGGDFKLVMTRFNRAGG